MFPSKALSFAVVALPFVARCKLIFMLNLTFVLNADFLPCKTAVVAHCNRKYTIQEGDICDSISATHNVSTYQLATINAGYIDNACSNLHIGATICLGYLNEDCSDTYVVKAKDTCEDIVAKFSIDEATLYNNNPNINDKCSNIYIGEVLCVASSIAVPPAGSSIAATAIPSTATAAISAVTSSTVSIATPITSSTVTPVTSSTVIPVTTSAAAPVTTSTAASATTVTYATTSSSAASAATSAASTDDGDDDDNGGDEDDGDDDDLPWCDEL
ncbi:hypothetical protein DFS33DRAFT_1278320 [Desarmillaria ectypa]|nr:hypothetical protein DFS33DRAFT_1278320 [Desarmillaria ectypa]